MSLTWYLTRFFLFHPHAGETLQLGLQTMTQTWGSKHKYPKHCQTTQRVSNPSSTNTSKIAIFKEKVMKMIWGFGPYWFCITYKECMLMWDATNKTTKAWKQLNSWDVVIEDRHRNWHVFIHHVMCWRMLEPCKPWARENNHSLWCYVNCHYTHADVSAS